MGGGNYDPDKYSAAAAQRRASGQDDFDYSQKTRSQSQEEWKCNPLLDPRGIKGVREARDSAEHPTSLAIMTFFDVTGSMNIIPTIFQKALNQLMNVIKERCGVKHPQILVGANGDTRNGSGEPDDRGSDRVPFQIGQFESDNRVDEQLRLFFLEGGGQGQVHESYGLAHYAAGWKTAIDCWEKRGQKGILFTMGDEMPWPELTRAEISRVFGDTVERDFTMEELVARAQEKYEVFHIIISMGNHGRDPRVEKRWRSLLGERVLRLDDPEQICELIASTIAGLSIKEGKSSADTGSDKKSKPDKKKDKPSWKV